MLVKNNKPCADEQASRDLPPWIARNQNELMARWREFTQSLPEPRCDAQTIAKLAEIPSVVIKELHDAIEADLHQPTVSKMAKRVAAVRESRQIDETDPNLVGLFEPNFSDREHRTPEQVRKLADEAVRDLRQQGKGNKPYYPQPEGIDPATKCALIISIKLNWPGSEPDKLRPLARHCTRPQGAILRARQIAPTDFGAIICANHGRSGANTHIAASSNLTCNVL